MPTFFYEYEILPKFREDAMTLIGGAGAYKDSNPEGVTLAGRWHALGDARGFGLFNAVDAKSVMKWLSNFKMSSIKVFPVLDDNQFRRIVLGKEPEYIVSYDGVADKPPPGESLYILKYKFYDGEREKGFKVQAKEKEDEAKAWAGTCTSLGRWHNLAEGAGYVLFSSPDEEALYKWIHNWGKGKGNSIAHREVIPVCNIDETCEVITGKPDFAKKHAALMKKMMDV